MKTRKIAEYGLLVALAMIMSYAEAQIPAFFPVPGMKLGLTNIVVLFALYCMDTKSALEINFLRVILVSFLFGNAMGFAYSLAGALLSGFVMFSLKKTGWFGIVTVSIAGGIAHNVGQILVAMAVMGTKAVAWYLLALWFTGMASGTVIGVIGAQICKRMKGRMEQR